MLLDPLLTALSWLLGIIVPRDRQLVVIGGRQFGGNTRPLLEQSARYGLRGVWLTGRPEILALGRENVFSIRSLRGLWLGARAGAVLLTHSLGDFSPLYFGSRRVRLYNLWHGMPIKRIARADPRFPKRSYARSFGREMGRYRAMFATSPAMVRLFEESFALPAERIRITGQPRTDALLSGATPDLTGRYDPPLPAHRRRILYCPTWRDEEPVQLFPFVDRDLEAVQRFLQEREALLFVRTHPNDPGRLDGRQGRILPMQADVVAEVTDTLRSFDVLVTDYSSVYYDYLLLDRPVIFLPYDLERYTRSPGFFLPFEEIVAGARPDTQAGFLSALGRALDQPEAESAERHRVRQLVYTHVDAGATERVLTFLQADLRS
ncbi:MAG: CDP-glycerol glycerophosphotransferase family protein [Sedimenticola sp.]